MGTIVSFFAGGPARIQALLIGAMAVAILCMGLLIYGGYWHIQALGMKAELVAAVDQGKVLASAVESCSAGVQLAQRTGDLALKQGAELLELARKRGAKDTAIAASIEKLAAAQRKAGEDCHWAWGQIQEAERKAGAAR